MWGSLLVLALLTTINPVRLGLILLVLLRPRPIQSLFAYWVGCGIAGLASVLIPLLVLHAIPTSASFTRQFADPAENPSARHISVGIGVTLLMIAALIAVRSVARRRAQLSAVGVGGRHRMPAGGSAVNASSEPVDPSAPPVISRLVSPAQDTEAEGGSAIARLLGRIRRAWQNGSPWPAFVIGVIVVPPLDGLLLVIALIVASGAAIEVQLIAAVAYIIGMLTVEEVILVSHLAAPAKTEAVLRRLHDWTITHQQKILVAFLAVVGLSLVARGMGFL